MPPRSLLLAFVLALVAATAARAQTYTPLLSADRYAAPGVRVGIGAGLSTYFGPDILNPNLDRDEVDLQDNVIQTRPAVSAFVSFPLSGDRLYGRLQAGLANLGADLRSDVPAGSNPFLTNEWFVGEGNLMLNLTSPRRTAVVPYLFSGFGAIVADPFGQDALISTLGHPRTAYFVPAGLGVDFRLSRNLSIFLEAGYRFVLNDAGRAYRISGAETATGGGAAPIFANVGMGDDPCEEKPDKPECGPKPPEEECDINPELPGCVLDEDSVRFDRRFNFGSLMGGIAIGFAPAPRAVYIPPPDIETPVEEVLPQVEIYPEPPVCELVELNSVYFDYGSATLTAGARSLLAENVQLLRENPECCIFVDGYTDSEEYDRFGMPLAGRRAQAVYDYYLDNGIGASRMNVRNRGVTTPSCDKEDEGPGCTRGRRVETIPMDCPRFQELIESGAGY
ncbi:MAG TPA: OmpA family protein [Rhodothermales bacterium]|nr:OmpA family protein [Rhodothermales bacterium]